MPSTSALPHLRVPDATDYNTMPGWVPDAAACHRWAGPDLPFPFSGADLPALIAKPGAFSLVLADDNSERALGFGQFWVQQAGAVHLGRIILAPEARGRGLGPVLCKLLMAEAIRVTGAPAVTLKVHRDNPVAHAIYVRLGFIEAPSLSTDAVIFMRKEIVAQAAA